MAKRLKRTTNAQYEELIGFVEQHKVLLHGKTKPQEAGVVKQLWQQFADYINSLGLGPCKTADQWKKILFEWKCNIRRKTREMKIEMLRTGGGRNKGKKLTDTEERFQSVLSTIHLGSELLPDELGVDTEQNQIETYDVIQQTQCNVGNVVEIYSDLSLHHDIYESGCELSENTERVALTENDDPNIPQKALTDKPSVCQTPSQKKIVLGKNVNKNKGKKKSGHENRYTSRFMESAAKSYNEAQESRYNASVRSADSITALASAIEKFADVYKEVLAIEREKLEIAQITAEATKIKAEALQIQARTEFLKLEMNAL